MFIVHTNVLLDQLDCRWWWACVSSQQHLQDLFGMGWVTTISILWQWLNYFFNFLPFSLSFEFTPSELLSWNQCAVQPCCHLLDTSLLMLPKLILLLPSLYFCKCCQLIMHCCQQHGITCWSMQVYTDFFVIVVLLSGGKLAAYGESHFLIFFSFNLAQSFSGWLTLLSIEKFAVLWSYYLCAWVWL